VPGQCRVLGTASGSSFDIDFDWAGPVWQRGQGRVQLIGSSGGISLTAEGVLYRPIVGQSNVEIAASNSLVRNRTYSAP
jgi:hypothetical protein